MPLDPMGAALGLHRFGLGPRPGSIAAIASDPRGAIIADLHRMDVGQIVNADLPTSGAANRAVFEFIAERNAAQKLEKKRREARGEQGAVAENAGEPKGGAPKADAKAEELPKIETLPLPRQIFLREAEARVDAATHAEIGFVERLVWFWSNHFCVNADATVMAGGYEREAIRPHVLGAFVDILLAAESHPAMLLYLDNARSIGPNSVAGINRDKGLNENFAREILELHTLGVRTVYTQEDVTSFAKALTGWTILQTVSDPDRGGEFVFIKRMHEPSPQTVVGKTYQDTGAEQGRAVLRDLARHPATAKHVATKLVRHFVADDPPPPLVDRLAQCFLDTDGDLKAVATALVTAPDAWALERTKIKRPGEWAVAGLRASGVAIDIRRVLQAQVLLGEPLWRPPAPKGFSDDSASWLDGVAQRLAIANAFAQRDASNVDAQEVADVALGPLLTEETRRTLAGAESRQQALALLLMAPEFQRR
jgi:uncharacterized protein (DUF1800 family)